VPLTNYSVSNGTFYGPSEVGVRVEAGSTDFWAYSFTLKTSRATLPAGKYAFTGNVRAGKFGDMAVVLTLAGHNVVSQFNPNNGSPCVRLYPGVTDQYLQIYLPHQQTEQCYIGVLFGNSAVMDNPGNVLVRRWKLTYLGP